MTLAMPSGIIKALSLKQPYAWMIANGHLLVDDRRWGTGYRGPLLIHASNGFYPEYYHFISTRTDIPIPPREQLEHGGIVGIANLVACCKPGDVPANVSPIQRAHFGGVHQDCYGFLMGNARPLPFIPCSGKLGIFEIDLDAVRSAPRQMGFDL